MKKNAAFSILVFLLCSMSLMAQVITGKITDEQQQPIPYANVQVGSAIGIVSNEEGVFAINTQGLQGAEVVTFSCLGFESVSIPLSDFKGGTYVLKEKPIALNEVFVTNQKLSPEEILAQVVKNAPKNYSPETVKQTFFLRTSSTNKMIDSKFELVKSSLETKSELKELNKDIEALMAKVKNQSSKDYSESYGYLYEQNAASKLAVEKAIELKNREKDVSGDQMNGKLMAVIKKHLEPGASYKLTSGMFTIDKDYKMESKEKQAEEGHKTAYLKSKITDLSSALNKFYTNEDLDFLTEFKRYNYTLEGFSVFNGETIYIIDFEPKKSSADYYGKIYVNATDFAVVKLDYNLADGKNIHKVNLKLLLGVKMVEDREKISATFGKNEAGHYAVNFVKRQSATYAYIDRSFKLTKNKTDKKEEAKMLKVDMLLEIDNYVTNELFVINRQVITDEAFKATAEQEKYKIDYISKYDPSVWEGYNVLAPVEAIKNYN